MPRKLLLIDAENQAGEVRQVDGLLSMCLGERSYGGGSGPVWATPGEMVEFTVTKGWSRGYMVGLCQAIYPKKKAVALLIVKGNTWGDFKTGNSIEISADLIHRYHRTDRESAYSLTDLATKAKEHVYSNEVFRDLTLRELEEAFRDELADTSKSFLGEKAYQKANEFLRAYVAYAQNLRVARPEISAQPSKKLLASARRVRSLLGLEGKTVMTDVDDVIPGNLTPTQSAGYGAIVGALVGDAAGGVLEFLGRRPTRSDVDKALNMPGGGVFGLAPGQITDDGELTLCLLRALAEQDGVYSPSLVARYYIEWAHSQPFDIGNATSSALRTSGYELKAPDSAVTRAAAEHNIESKANGALMRISPLGVASAKVSEEEAITWAHQDARFTHPHATCLTANAAYVLAIRHMVLHPGDSEEAIRKAQAYLASQSSEVLDWIEEAIEGKLPPAHPQAGYVRIGFTYAFHHLSRRSSLRSALAETLLMGGDTDTNACIVGGLLGAYRGVTKLMRSEASRRLVYPVLMCDPSLGQTRPEAYHASSAPFWIPKII
jgi:ADP-ribosylglycohydrolase